MDVGGVDLTVNEVAGPWLAAPSGLWQAPGWVRGDVVLGFYGDSPSGVCGLGATINGQIVASSNSARNQTDLASVQRAARSPRRSTRSTTGRERCR